MYEVLQRSSLRESIIQQTGRDPDYIAKEGDPHGRFLLALPNLSGFDSFKLRDEHAKLPEIGEITQRSIKDKLDPQWSHKEYDAGYFIERCNLARRSGQKYSLVMA